MNTKHFYNDDLVVGRDGAGKMSELHGQLLKCLVLCWLLALGAQLLTQL